MAEEIPLAGGDVTEGVVSVGDTVRRPLGDHSPLVHKVLRHLEAVGFEGAPRFLGIDGKGREILTHVDGEVAGRPWPEWVADEERARSVARLARRLDDAMLPLGIPDGAGPVDPDQPGPAPTFIGHRDFTPENTVFRHGRATAFIDFDICGPASRVQEVTNLLLWWGAWMPVPDREPVMQEVDAADRGRAIVRAYGLDKAETAQVVPVARYLAERSWHRMRERALRDGGGWARMWDEGVGDRIRRRQAWLAENADHLAGALLS